MVASTLLRRRVWIALGLAAAAGLVFVAFHGEREMSAIGRFTLSGPLAATAEDDVVALRIAGGGKSMGFRRDGATWRREDGGPAPEAELAQGLRFLRATAPERVIAPDEAGRVPAADFGLDPPTLTVSLVLKDGGSAIYAMGGANPLGLGRYVRRVGSESILVMPGYVVEPWERAGRAP